jgi:hypothetical protein
VRSTQRSVVFSGAIAQPNEGPHAGYFGAKGAGPELAHLAAFFTEEERALLAQIA